VQTDPIRTQEKGGDFRVALAGYYGRGNFGDDLMAVLFGLALREAGVDFSVYRPNSREAGRFGFPVAQSPAELLEDAKLLIWGGGGLLVSWSPVLYELLFRGVAREYANLVAMAVSRGVRCAALSVGGSGECPARLTPGYKQDFVSAAEYISVRNPQDLRLLERNGLRGEYFPDVVWRAADSFPVPPRVRGARRIGIDLYLSNLARRQALYLVPLLLAITRIRSDCEFILLDSTNQEARPYRGLARLIRGPNVGRRQFSDLAADLEFLASLDLLVSSRLHTPMVCMGYGVPALSLFGEKKTALMMQNLNLAACTFSHRNIRSFAALLSRREKLGPFLEQYPFPDIVRLRRESCGHLERLHALLRA